MNDKNVSNYSNILSKMTQRPSWGIKEAEGYNLFD